MPRLFCIQSTGDYLAIYLPDVRTRTAYELLFHGLVTRTPLVEFHSPPLLRQLWGRGGRSVLRSLRDPSLEKWHSDHGYLYIVQRILELESRKEIFIGNFSWFLKCWHQHFCFALWSFFFVRVSNSCIIQLFLRDKRIKVKTFMLAKRDGENF